jgi:hypothetical protein
MSGQFIDAPAPKFIDAPAPGSPPPASGGGIDLGGIAKKVGGAIEGAGRNLGAMQTAAARDPVGALGNVLGAAEGGVAGAVMEPALRKGPSSLIHTLQDTGSGALRGATDPKERDRYNAALGDLMFNGIRPQGESMPARIGRGIEDFGLQTAIDPVTHGGAQAAGALLKGGKATAGAVARGVKPVGDWAGRVQKVAADTDLGRSVGKVAHAIGEINPIPGIVNAGKDVMFLNPFPHGLGNMTVNNYLANGLGTAAKGLWYGVRGAPKATVAELNRIKAGAWTPELLDKPSPWGPVGWMDALGKKGVPAAVRAGVGGAAGGTIANKTADDTATPQQRLARTAEGAILGALTGASPEALKVSNKVMSHLETAHRAAMLEDMAKPVAQAAAKPHYSAAEVAANLRKAKRAPVQGPATINTNPHAIPPNAPGKIFSFQHGLKPEAPPDPRADAINGVFGGAPKSNVARVASALGGPFAQWQADTVPRVVGNALRKAPARVEAFARGQDIANRDVLKDQPYKVQVGGPVGGASEMIFDPQKYLSRLMGPLGASDPNAATNPKTLSIGDFLKDKAYDATPGRDVVGPFFGDTKYPNRAPAIPSASLDAALGWHFANKTPRKDAVLSIMRATGLNQQQADQVYQRYKR